MVGVAEPPAGRRGRATAAGWPARHRDFKQPVTATLKSNPAGRVLLGELKDITSVTASGPEGTAHTWTLPTDRHTYRQIVHARAGEVVSLPYLGVAPQASREELALFEVNGSRRKSAV